MVRRQSNKELLKAYKQELASVRQQLNNLSGRHSALTSVVRGLELLEGTEPSTHESPQRDLVNTTSGGTLEHTTAEGTIINAGVITMRHLPRPKNLGASAIKGLLAKAGRDVSYSAFYVALKRESAKHTGLLYKSAKKFGLREWKGGES